jgi:UDP-glucose:(heptosyl)LPS alpha-1,3-glucosyltransferase
MKWLNLWLFALWTWACTTRSFDVVHTHESLFHGNVHTVNVKPIAINSEAKFKLNKRLFSMVQWLSIRLIAYRLMDHLRFFSSRQRIWVAGSESLRDELLSHFKLNPNQVFDLSPGVDLPAENNFEIRRHQQERARQELALRPELKYALLVAHDYEKKGLLTCLNAISKLSSEWHLLVVGKRDQRKDWSKIVNSQELESRVHFLGPMSQMDRVYWAADVLLHPTQEDVFPMVTLEAMAHWLPLIISPAPYCLSSRHLSHAANAMILTHPNRDDQVVDYIHSIENDSELRRSLMLNGRAFAAEHDWSVLANHLDKIYAHAYQMNDD